MKNFIAGIFSLVVLCCFSVTYAKTGDLNVTRINQKVTSCNADQSRDVNYYITGTSYTVYPLDNFRSDKLGDLLIGGKNNGSSIDIRSNGVISNCNDWGRASFVAPNNTRVRVFQNYDGCTFNIGKKSTDFVAQIHYNVGYKKIKDCSNNDPYVNGPLSYFPQNGTQYLSYNKPNNKICYNNTLNIHAGECLNYRIFRCGDGLINGYQGKTSYENGTFVETCDPQAQPWIDNKACDPVTCKGKTPVCRSSLNGETVQNLEESDYLCEIGTMTEFHETSTGWTWKCDNVAGTTTNCSATKGRKGTLDIEKTLVSETEYVTEVGQDLVWKVTVTAKGGDVKNVKIKDYLPAILTFKHMDPNLPEGVTMGSTVPVKGADSTGEYLLWTTEGTLKSGKSIVLMITTKVNTMPEATDNYKNVACASAEGVPEDCKPVPVKTKGSLNVKKEIIKPDDGVVTKKGEEVVWKIIVKAEGGDVKMEYIKDTLPAELKYENYEVKHNPNGITISNPQISSNGIIWKTTGTLQSGDYIELHLYTTLKDDPKKVKNLINIACAKPNPGEEECRTGSTTKLRITKEVLNGTIRDKSVKLNKGDTITYKITFGNDGNKNVFVDIKDFLPKGVTFISGSLTIGQIQQGGRTVEYNNESGLFEVIYSGLFLPGGSKGILIINARIPDTVEEGQNTTNFACIFKKGDSNSVDCSDATYSIHNLKPCVGDDCDPTPSAPSCTSLEPENGTLVCRADKNAYFTIFCDGKKDNAVQMARGEQRKEFKYDNYKNCKHVKCYVSKDRLNGSAGSKCERDNPNESEASQQCFNVNAGNFSIHEGEIFPFYWNLFNMENWVKNNKDNYIEVRSDYRQAPENYDNKYDDADCTDGKIATDSMVCTFKIYYGGDNETPLYKIEGPCLTNRNSKPLENNNLLKARYTEMKKAYCNNPNSSSCYFSYNDKRESTKSLLPSAVYYIEKFGSGAELSLDGNKWEGNRGLEYDINNEKNAPYGEYKIRLESVKYLKCVGGSWAQKDAKEDADFKPCESNFVVTNPYTVQKTPSGNLTASTEELGKYKYLSGSDVFSSLINAIETTKYESNNQVEKAMETFISKYSKLAVEVNLGNDSFLNGTSVRKVPGKNIYFVDGDLTIKGGSQTIKNAFTIVQTNTEKTVTIVGNVQHNMMLLTNGNIKFEGNDCTEDQTVKGIFYAKGKLSRSEQYRNDVSTKYVWCTHGGLHVKGVLIGNNFDKLMKASRSHLNDRFKEENKKKSVMNGASVLIEYSPSIFTKSTMPPGAEDFTTALSIYKK